MKLVMGAHVDALDPIVGAESRGAGLAQLFLGDPQGWKAPWVHYRSGAAALKADAEAASIELYVHAPYVLNVATLNNRVRIPSRKLLQQQVKLAAEIGAKGVVVHAGHVGSNDDPALGFDNWRKCVAGLELPVPIFIENTAGGANAMARKLERVERLWDAISAAPNADRVGFCLDTCHAHAAGEPFDDLVDRVLGITGRIDLVHCNDSRDAFDSGADRHANLGLGQIDPEALVHVVRGAGAPVVLETPGGKAEHIGDLTWLRARL